MSSSGSRGLSFLLPIFVLLSVGCLQANISLSLQIELSTADSVLTSSIEVLNSGDEAAHDLQLTLRHGEQVSVLPMEARLQPQSGFRQISTLPLGDTGAGRHPLFVTLLYTDANGYPFSAVVCPTFLVDSELPPDIVGTMRTEPLATSSRMTVRAKNVATHEIRSQVSVLTPREFSVGEYGKEIRLEPGQETEFAVPIRNFSALPGSRYPVYVALEYEKDGIHHTSVLAGQVEVIDPSLFTLYRPWILGAAGIFLLLGIAFLILRSTLPSQRRTG